MTDYTDFFTKGVCVIPNSGLIHYLGDIDNYIIKDAGMIENFDPTEYDIPKELFDPILKIREIIINRHLLQVFKQYITTTFSIWDGVDSGTHNWHNDKAEGCGLDCNFLLYIDDTDTSTGGALFVRGPGTESKIYPKKDMLIWLNQNELFSHRAERSTTTRRLIGYDFILPQLR